MRSFFSMCSALVARKMWARERGASSSAAAAASMSVGLVRQSEAIVARVAARATCPDSVEVAGRGGGEAGLDHVDTEPLELLADLDLLVRPQGDARRLLAVS
jgi:hypothetical protein